MKPCASRSFALPLLFIAPFAFAVTACSAPDEATGSNDSAVSSCGASLERYPVAGPYNCGYDPNALTFSCGGERANTDFYRGAGDTNHANGHLGNDIFGARGTPIVVAQAGVVTEAGFSSIGGNNVVIRDDCGWSYYYAHLDSLDAGNAVIGRHLQAGTKLGELGNTGQAQSGAPHLHFSVYPDGTYERGIDPFPILQSVAATACSGSVAAVDPAVIEPRPEGGPFAALDIRHAVSSGKWITQCNESLDGERVWKVTASGADAGSRWAKAAYPQLIRASCGSADGATGILPLVFRNDIAGELASTWVLHCADTGHNAAVYRVTSDVDGHPAAPFHHYEPDDTCP
jgi:Peptidase family M23